MAINLTMKQKLIIWHKYLHNQTLIANIHEKMIKDESIINGIVEIKNEDNIVQAPVTDSCINGLLRVFR